MKGELYARYAIPEYWIVDVHGKRLTRYRDAASGGYARVDEPDLGRVLEIGRLPGVAVDLIALFVD